MPIPNEIPVGARIVVRTLEGVDPTDHRMKSRDYAAAQAENTDFG